MEELLQQSARVVQKMIDGFGPKVPGFDHFEFGDHKKLKKQNKQKYSSNYG